MLKKNNVELCFAFKKKKKKKQVRIYFILCKTSYFHLTFFDRYGISRGRINSNNLDIHTRGNSTNANIACEHM